MIYEKGECPFDIVIETLCSKYHKLPNEILNEDLEWIFKLTHIENLRSKQKYLQEKRRNLTK